MKTERPSFALDHKYCNGKANNSSPAVTTI